VVARPPKCRTVRGNWLRGQDLNLRPSGYEGDFTQPADGRRHSCFQSFRAVARDRESTQVHFRIHESPPVWTRSGQGLRARSHDRVFRAFNRGDRVVANHTVEDTSWASKGAGPEVAAGAVSRLVASRKPRLGDVLHGPLRWLVKSARCVPVQRRLGMLALTKPVLGARPTHVGSGRPEDLVQTAHG